MQKKAALELFPLPRSATGTRILMRILPEPNLRAIESEMKKARAISPDGDHRIQCDDSTERTRCSHKGGCQSGRGYYHIRCRTAYRSSCAYRGKQYKDRSDRVHRQVGECDPEILGQKNIRERQTL